MRKTKTGNSLLGVQSSIGASVIAGAFAIAGMLTGCADENPWANSSTETGSIELTLTADYDFDTAKPVFTRAEGENEQLPSLESIGVTPPSIEDFDIQLIKPDGTVAGWKYSEFKEYAKTAKFESGIYTLTATCQGVDETTENSESLSTSGFNCYYFEGSTKFTVIPNRKTEIDLTADLKNSMVQINFDQSFIDYVEEGFSAFVRNSSESQMIPFVKDENRVAFVSASTTELSVAFTTKITGKEQTATVSIGHFQAVAKTLHKITIAIDQNSNGFATLTVNFDETVEGGKNENIDLTEELYSAPAPDITCYGFSNGQYIDISGGVAADKTYSMKVTALGGMQSATLTIDGVTTPWGNSIDLCTDDQTVQTQLSAAGINARGFFGTETEQKTVGTIDITNFVKNIPTESQCSIMLTVKDKKGKTYTFKNSENETLEGAKVSFDRKQIALTRITDGDDNDDQSEAPIVYGSNKAKLKMAYNGGDPQNISFTAQNESGNQSNAEVISYNEITMGASLSPIGTRAPSETKYYEFTLNLPYSTNSNITVKAIHKLNNAELGTFDVPVEIPKYSLQSDAFAYVAKIKVIPENPDFLDAIMENIEFESISDRNVSKETNTDIITITGLNPSTPYTLKSSIPGSDNNSKPSTSFTTETATNVTNGDFTATTETINKKDVDISGKYSYSVSYQATANIVRSEANGWASINAKTCWFDCPGDINTWFQVPSTYAENGQVVLRNVAYDHNGVKPDPMPSGFGKTYWYNTNVPTFTNFAAGELFLGTYSFDGSEHRVDGITFSSRPSSVEFYYTYDPTGNDKAYVEVKLLNTAGAVISEANSILLSKAKEIDKEEAKFQIKLPAYPFGEKASKLIICFRSSTESSPKDFVHIPSGDQLSEGLNGVPGNFGNINLGNNNYHSVATGSVLTLDNVKLLYEGAPATSNAPSNSNRNRKR